MPRAAGRGRLKPPGRFEAGRRCLMEAGDLVGGFSPLFVPCAETHTCFARWSEIVLLGVLLLRQTTRRRRSALGDSYRLAVPSLIIFGLPGIV